MPDRHGYKVDGGWASGNDQVNGNNVPQTLTVDNRNSNNPTEYKASQWIEITDGFESGTSDDFMAYIADGSNTTAGNTSGSGGQYNVYRYGFNGKDNDDEVKGEGNQQDYGMRIYDGRLGRFLSVDPLTSNFAFYTPYQFAGNMPIMAIDLDGAEPKTIITNNGRLTEPMIHLLNSVSGYNENFLRAMRFGWTNDKVKLADNQVAVVQPNRSEIVINRSWQDSYVGDSYELFWLNVIVHEIKHKEQVSSSGKEVAFSEMANGIMELEGHMAGDQMENLVRSGQYNNLFDSQWAESDRNGLADYIGINFKLQNENSKLTDQKHLRDIYKGQLKLLKNGQFPAENKEAAIKDMNSKIQSVEADIDQTKNKIKEDEKKKAELEKKYSKIINTSYQ